MLNIFRFFRLPKRCNLCQMKLPQDTKHTICLPCEAKQDPRNAQWFQ